MNCKFCGRMIEQDEDFTYKVTLLRTTPEDPESGDVLNDDIICVDCGFDLETDLEYKMSK